MASDDVMLERQREVQLNNYLAKENPVVPCDWCGRNICDFDDYYEFGEDKVCECCVNDAKKGTDRFYE